MHETLMMFGWKQKRHYAWSHTSVIASEQLVHMLKYCILQLIILHFHFENAASKAASIQCVNINIITTAIYGTGKGEKQ